MSEWNLPAIGTGFIGLMFLLYPLYAFWQRSQQRRRRSERTTGRVMDEAIQHSANFNGARNATRHGVVAYEVEGHPYQVTAETGASWQILAPDDPVTVAYNPTDPQDAGVEDDSLKMVETAIFIILPLVGIVMLYKAATGI